MLKRKVLWPPILTFLFFLSATGSSQNPSESPQSKSIDTFAMPGKPQKPYFDDIGPKNISAVVGQSAMLTCRVKHPGHRTVSWMRQRDLHVLTSGIHTYTGDGRFSVRHPDHSDDWDLRIEYVQKRDEGVYDCQVNTEPKISLQIFLHVDDAQANIAGPSEIYVKKGSTISLTCTVNVHSTPPATVLWYQGRSVVNFDSPRGGISLETEKTEHGTTSKLLVTKALLTDTGNYTCMPSNATPASVIVHVLNGEQPAAMQTSNGHRCISLTPLCITNILLLILLSSI
ncbi:lachesin-like isoform X1 [Anthonomus grandis grandis]|uniref:lachesin-like isoform X1 n=1 Tax=Anthonomus grandis grandis TaxID=2921223 RepID=UPI00216616A1|nr:lachesin-like isoform X1 [Anthonomus grandis grandis]XP_050294341.1 lachesin-like isoform X1 [Anthonomus grandis grandis]